MKRKLILLTAMLLAFSLLFTACGEKPVAETNAKQIALDYINNIFDTNETQATVKSEEMECYPDQEGAVATRGNAAETSRWLYIVEVLTDEGAMKYQVYVVASTGEVIYATQSDANITPTSEQMAEADKLEADEPTWGKQHEKALSKLKTALEDLTMAKLDEARPIILDATLARLPSDPIRTTFANWYYVITRDGRVYWVAMQWPSMQLSAIALENPK